MKKTVKSVLLAFFAAVTLAFSVSAAVAVENEDYYAAFRDKGITLNVYNWGEYISDGSDGSLDVIKEFEEISGINVNYTLFDTNEDMYAKVVHGGSQYDIIIPSDYMIARLIDEDRLEKLDFDKIPNLSLIDEKYRYTDFDPEGAYSVPYTWGMVGLVVVWWEKYNGKSASW